MNAQDCFGAFNKGHLALVRNRLFTAITRSKAWVRVIGLGTPMEGLEAEWEQLRKNDYKLTFRYPTAEEKLQLRIINKETPRGRKSKRAAFATQATDILDAVERGEVDADQLIDSLKEIKARRVKQ